MASSTPRGSWSWGLTIPAALLIAAIVTTAPVWHLHAVPVLTTAAADKHVEHFAWVYIHMLGGTAMLVLGALALYVGWTRRQFRFHKYIGYAYLTGGAVGAGAGLALSILNPHPPHGVAIATGTLAATWLAFAAMAYRAARNRRFDVHRDWMIRTYVLTWTFAFCRLAMRLPIYETYGAEGITATIWLSWVVPLLVCEIALQWRRASPLQPGAS
jgi:hypothetical protein